VPTPDSKKLFAPKTKSDIFCKILTGEAKYYLLQSNFDGYFPIRKKSHTAKYFLISMNIFLLDKKSFTIVDKKSQPYGGVLKLAFLAVLSIW
jgi:hypothetical protein